MVRDSKAVQVAAVISILMLSSLAHGKEVWDACIYDNYSDRCNSLLDQCKTSYEDVLPVARRNNLILANCFREQRECVRRWDEKCRCYDSDGVKRENCASDQKARTATNPRYVIKGDTVYDKETNLTWMRCSVGRWLEATGRCSDNKSKTLAWKQAKSHLARDGWRLPTVDELLSLSSPYKDIPGYVPAQRLIDKEAFPDFEMHVYWTSEDGDAEGRKYNVFFPTRDRKDVRSKQGYAEYAVIGVRTGE